MPTHAMCVLLGKYVCSCVGDLYICVTFIWSCLRRLASAYRNLLHEFVLTRILMIPLQFAGSHFRRQSCAIFLVFKMFLPHFSFYLLSGLVLSLVDLFLFPFFLLPLLWVCFMTIKDFVHFKLSGWHRLYRLCHLPLSSTLLYIIKLFTLLATYVSHSSPLHTSFLVSPPHPSSWPIAYRYASGGCVASAFFSLAATCATAVVCFSEL